MSKLTTGGPSGLLAPNWRAPWGWAGGPTDGALWVGATRATEDDIEELEQLGHKAEKSTLVGTRNIRWDAPQYRFQKRAIASLQPTETVGRPGGDGSWAYKGQKLPRRADGVAKKGDLLYLPNGNAFRAKGGEVYREKWDEWGEGYMDKYVMRKAGIAKWSAQKKLWLRK